tara:strand:- start:2368 stop:2880 length:513 start_codon:yes stop_codon:yes gene_type:complete
MIAMVVNSQYRCLVMSDLPPVYKSDGHSADDYTGCDTLDHVSEGQDVWKAAIDNCLSERVDTSCEFCNEYNSVVSRWRATMRYLETDRVLVTIRRVPSAIHELSDRERDVLNEVARGKTNAQVAESLGISLSTVEKHRNRIRQTLNLSNEQELHLTAWMVANPDIFHGLP